MDDLIPDDLGPVTDAWTQYKQSLTLTERVRLKIALKMATVGLWILPRKQEAINLTTTAFMLGFGDPRHDEGDEENSGS